MKQSKRALRWHLLSFFLVGLNFVIFNSCDEKKEDVLFTGDSYQNILQYIDENQDKYAKFKELIEIGGLMDALSSYNSHLGGNNYTLFLPDDAAVELFIAENHSFDSFDELLKDIRYVKSLVRYHIVNAEISANDFPHGALNARTLSDDFLTVNFSADTDGAISYKINDEAGVIIEDILKSNGIVHVIDKMLTPIVYTAYEWIQNNQTEGFQIFAELLDITGLQDTLNYYETNPLGALYYPGYTLLAESDALYNQIGIFSLEDLIQRVSPDNEDFTSSANELNKFATYHILDLRVFLDQFSALNYNTYGEFPISVDIVGEDLHFNVGTEVFEWVEIGEITTPVNYLEIDISNSNILTKTGPIHQLNRVLFPFRPDRRPVDLQFYNESVIRELSDFEGTFRIGQEALQVISLFGPDYLFYTKSNSDIPGVQNNDYIHFNGDFEMVYQTPKILAGTYELQLVADRSSTTNAMIQVFVNGEKAGGLVDLTSGNANHSNFRPAFVLSLVSFAENGVHEIRIKTVKPGRLFLDGFILNPVRD